MDHVYGATLADVAELLQRQWEVKITHVLRGANTCADFVAKVGANNQHFLEMWLAPPQNVLPILNADRLGTISLIL